MDVPKSMNLNAAMISASVNSGGAPRTDTTPCYFRDMAAGMCMGTVSVRLVLLLLHHLRVLRPGLLLLVGDGAHRCFELLRSAEAIESVIGQVRPGQVSPQQPVQHPSRRGSCAGCRRSCQPPAETAGMRFRRGPRRRTSGRCRPPPSPLQSRAVQCSESSVSINQAMCHVPCRSQSLTAVGFLLLQRRPELRVSCDGISGLVSGLQSTAACSGRNSRAGGRHGAEGPYRCGIC